MRNLHFYRPATQRLTGFSLVELLIVMAVLAAVAGLTLPAMRGPLDKSRLTGGAKLVQASLAKARALAIREGCIVQFRYEIPGQRYVIEKVLAMTDETITVLDDSSGSATTPSGLTPSPEASLTQSPSPESGRELTEDSAAPSVLREGQLPPGVSFGEMQSWSGVSELSGTGLPGTGLAGPEATSETSSIGATSSGGLASGGSLSGIHWSAPVHFLPSGRASDQVIRLNGQRDFFVDVTLRGLTATASYSAPGRLPPAAAAALADDAGVLP